MIVTFNFFFTRKDIMNVGTILFMFLGKETRAIFIALSYEPHCYLGIFEFHKASTFIVTSLMIHTYLCHFNLSKSLAKISQLLIWDFKRQVADKTSLRKILVLEQSSFRLFLLFLTFFIISIFILIFLLFFLFIFFFFFFFFIIFVVILIFILTLFLFIIFFTVWFIICIFFFFSFWFFFNNFVRLIIFNFFFWFLDCLFKIFFGYSQIKNNISSFPFASI